MNLTVRQGETMDLVETLRNKIDSLEEGTHTPGLRAVVLHIETAFRHLERGQTEQDETAFTDAIYRTNQAFEGSIKEAYRVLAEKEPAKKRPYDIEKYLEENQVFRRRVLGQFTNYRTEWRNPSAHDYKLDFDESEAFLAIVNISAFACLVMDQIAQQLAYLHAKEGADSKKAESVEPSVPIEDGLVQQTTALFQSFSREQLRFEADNPRKTEMQVVGALTGFLASVAPDIRVQVDPLLSTDRGDRGDMLLSKDEESVLVELKNGRWARKNYYNAITQVEHYLLVSGLKSAILYFYDDEPFEPVVKTHEVPALDACITVISPSETLPNKANAADTKACAAD